MAVASARPRAALLSASARKCSWHAQVKLLHVIAHHAMGIDEPAEEPIEAFMRSIQLRGRRSAPRS